MSIEVPRGRRVLWVVALVGLMLAGMGTAQVERTPGEHNSSDPSIVEVLAIAIPALIGSSYLLYRWAKKYTRYVREYYGFQQLTRKDLTPRTLILLALIFASVLFLGWFLPLIFSVLFWVALYLKGMWHRKKRGENKNQVEKKI
ncbi:MAG: hypothetical protein HY558_05945 [Euryarchaeota archaeon]|nr:hypothetical protein [Euryarchaeota archaeon]